MAMAKKTAKDAKPKATDDKPKFGSAAWNTKYKVGKSAKKAK